MAQLKTSNIIRKAKTYLWNGAGDQGQHKEEYICFAVTSAIRNGVWGVNASPEAEQRASEIRAMIESRLAPFISLESWLMKVGNVPRSALNSRRLQEHRRQWMDMLIAEFEAKGD